MNGGGKDAAWACGRQTTRKQLADVVARLNDSREELLTMRTDLATGRARAEQDRSQLTTLLKQLRQVQGHHVDQEAELRVVFERYYQVRPAPGGAR